MKELKRKCTKCGKSPALDPSVALYRFPRPGKTNILRCESWARYCFPQAAWSSVEFQTKLFAEHRMLCNEHFKETSFIDFTSKKLHRFSCPYDECKQNQMLVATCTQVHNMEHLPGTSKAEAGPPPSTTAASQPFRDLTNFHEQNKQMLVANCTQAHKMEPLPGTSKAEAGPPPSTSAASQPFRDLTNLHEQSKQLIVPTVTVPTVTTTVDLPIKIKEKTAEVQNLYKKCRKNMKDICRLKKRITKLKNESFLKTLSDEKSVNSLISNKMTPTFAILLQSQLKNVKRKPRARRWSKNEKIIALRLFKRSPTCYRLLRRLFCLPSPGTLKTVLNKLPIHVGINIKIFDVMTKFIQTQKQSDNEFILMFDEMAIKKNLLYNKKEDYIEGFQDHANHGRTFVPATYALVFMIAGIRKKVKQPIAFYFSGSSVTADRLSVLIKEVLKHCFEAEINVSATVCDLDGVNKRALNILGASVDQPYILQNNREVVTLFDSPHLLKCFRNLFLKYDIKIQTNIKSGDKSGQGVAKWSHVKQFYEVDNANPNFVFAPTLKKEHLNPNSKQKMRVKIAAQVLSHTVAAGMYAKMSQGELPADAAVTANMISNMDKLFDSVNADSPDLKRGKSCSTNLTDKTPHLDLWRQMIFFFKNMTYIDSPRKPPSQDGWVQTLNGIQRLWSNLKKKGIRSLATRRLQQDPLENCFGCIRSNCGSNANPTVGQFVGGLKTAVLSNLSHIGSGANCEGDTNIVLSNLISLLTPTTEIRTDACSMEVEKDLNDQIGGAFQEFQEMDDSNPELQACAYVCGFILKNLKNDCDVCKKLLMSDEHIDTLHLFLQFKEYDDVKYRLKYASKAFILCVEQSATLVNNFLATEAHTVKLKSKISYLLSKTNYFDFLDCFEHKTDNVQYIINSVFYICVKRFCVLKNRKFSEDASMSALKKKIDILKHV